MAEESQIFMFGLFSSTAAATREIILLKQLLGEHLRHSSGSNELFRGCSGKEPACQCWRNRDAGLIPGFGRSPGEDMATHSSILAWKSP